jgi:hypothetical protein
MDQVQTLWRAGNHSGGSNDPFADLIRRLYHHGINGLELLVDATERLSRTGPSAVLEGIIRQIDNRMRLIIRLVDCADGSYLWSSRYDRAVDDDFAVQDELSKTIVEELRGFLRSP